MLTCAPPPRNRHERDFARLVGTRLLPVLGREIAGRPVTLRDRVVEGHSTSPHIRILEIDGAGPAFVVRAFFRFYNPLRRGGRFDRFRHAASVGNLARERGVNAVRTTSMVEGVDWGRWQQYWMGCEEFIDGREIGRRDRAQIEGYYGQLAKLHNIASPRWGAETGARSGDVASYPAADLSRFLRRRLAMLDVRPERCDPVLRTVADRAGQVLRVLGNTPFSLVHGDARTSNALCDAEGNVWLIDFLHARYSLAALDFLDSLGRVCGGNGLANEAAAAYFRALRPEVAKQYESDLSLFLFLAAVNHATSGSDRKSATRPAFDSDRAGALLDAPAKWPPGDWEEVVGSIRKPEFLRQPAPAGEERKTSSQCT